MTINHYIALKQSDNTPESDSKPLNVNFMMGLIALLFAISSLIIAAFMCAVISGYNLQPKQNRIIPYAMATDVSILFSFGSFFALIGGLYAFRFYRLARGTHLYCYLIDFSTAVLISLIHQHISVQLYVATCSYMDSLWWWSIAILVVGHGFRRYGNRPAMEVSENAVRQIRGWALGMFSLAPLTIIFSAGNYLSLKATMHFDFLPTLQQYLFYSFYPVLLACSLYSSYVFAATADTIDVAGSSTASAASRA
jgi:hypothetical protein